MWSHQRQAQVVAPLRRQRETDEATAVGGHEIDDLRSNLLRGNGQIALVFPVFIIHHNQNAPGADLLDRFRDGDEGHKLIVAAGGTHAWMTSAESEYAITPSRESSGFYWR